MSFLALLMMFVMFGGIAAVGVGIYRRLSKPAGGVESGAFQDKLLFEIDRLRVQMQIANERLERLEAGHLALPRRDEPRDTGARSIPEEVD